MNKRSYIVLDLLRSAHFGLNPTESILASFLFNLIARFEPIPVNGKWFYMADYAYVSENCKMLPEKSDTLRRLYKRLENIGLIEIMKIGTHICFSPSDALREWGTEANFEQTEINPGNDIKSANAEKNPGTTEKNPINAEKNPLPYICINNKESNKESNIVANEVLTTEKKKEPLKLFRNWFPDFDKGDYSELDGHFQSSAYSNVDLAYYYNSVADWSDTKNMKRTKRGWFATIRMFMRGDNDKGKLKTLTANAAPSKINVADALQFLNDDY